MRKYDGREIFPVVLIFLSAYFEALSDVVRLFQMTRVGMSSSKIIDYPVQCYYHVTALGSGSLSSVFFGKVALAHVLICFDCWCKMRLVWYFQIGEGGR